MEKTNDAKRYQKLLSEDVRPVKLGNKNKTGKCGMCRIKSDNLHPCKVGNVEFMICDRCKGIMDM